MAGMSANRLLQHPLMPAVTVWVLAALAGLVPPFSRDALNDHLVLPLIWLREGFGWRDAGLGFTAYPPLADIPYLLFAGQSWDWAASAWHACAALLVLLLLDRTARHLHMPPSVRRFVALGWMCTPVVLVLCTWSYVDLWLCVVAASCAERLSRPGWRRCDAWIYGACIGLGALVKYNGLVLAVAAWLALLWRWRAHPACVWRYAWPAAAGAVVVAAWWYVANTLWLETPVPAVGADGLLSWLTYRQQAYGELLWWAALAPLRAFFWGETGSARLFDGMLHPGYLLGLAGAWRLRLRGRAGALGLLGLVYMLMTLTTGVRARYLLPGVLVWLPLAGVLLWRLSRLSRGALMAAVFAPAFIAAAIYFHGLAPWIFWQQGRDAFLRRQLPDYGMQHWISAELPANVSIYLLWMGGRAYYLGHRYGLDFNTEGKRLRTAIKTGKILPYDYVLMRRDLAERTLGADLGPAWTRFLAASCLVRKDGAFELWRMRPCG